MSDYNMHERYARAHATRGDEQWSESHYHHQTASPDLYASAANNQQWVQHPATSGMDYGGYQSPTTYAPHGCLPMVTSTYGRGSTNPGDYRYGYSASTAEMAQSAQTWPTSSDQPTYDPRSYDEYGEDSSSGSDGPGSPMSTNADSVASPSIASTAFGSPMLEFSSRGSPPSGKASKEKKFTCTRVVLESNTTCYKAFARKADLQRHELCVHDKHKVPRLDCKYTKCDRKAENGFLRKDHLTEHLRHFHGKVIEKRSRRASANSQAQDYEDDDASIVQQSTMVMAHPGYNQY